MCLAFHSLARYPGIGPKKFSQLIDFYKSAQEALDANSWRDCGIHNVLCPRDHIKKNIENPLEWIQELAQHERQTAQSLGILFVGIDDPKYPLKLKDSPQPPPLLSIWGDIDVNHFQWSALVGTRNPSSCASAITQKLVQFEKNQGFGVISGMAKGIDRMAHFECFEQSVPTIAVLGSGLLGDTRADHLHWCQQILTHSGLLISQFPLWSQANKGSFPMRNQVVAGISQRVVVIESRIQGGAMLTARNAIEMGTELWTIGTKESKTQSEGPNWLIDHQLAQQHPAFNIDTLQTVIPELDPIDLEIWKVLHAPQTAEFISHHLNIQVSEVLTKLGLLELEGHVETQNGGLYAAKKNYA